MFLRGAMACGAAVRYVRLHAQWLVPLQLPQPCGQGFWVLPKKRL